VVPSSLILRVYSTERQAIAPRYPSSERTGDSTSIAPGILLAVSPSLFRINFVLSLSFFRIREEKSIQKTMSQELKLAPHEITFEPPSLKAALT